MPRALGVDYESPRMPMRKLNNRIGKRVRKDLDDRQTCGSKVCMPPNVQDGGACLFPKNETVSFCCWMNI